MAVEFYAGLCFGLVLLAGFCLWFGCRATRLIEQAFDRVMARSLGEYRALLVPDGESAASMGSPVASPAVEPLDELHADDLLTDEELSVLTADMETGVTRYLNV